MKMIFKFFIILNCLAICTQAFVRVPLKKRINKRDDVLPRDNDPLKILFQGAEPVIQITVEDPTNSKNLKTFNVVLDTTTNVFWIASENCQSRFCKNTKNTIWKDENGTPFDNNNIKGHKSSYKVTLDGFPLKSTEIVAVSKVYRSEEERLNGIKVDGVLGLSNPTFIGQIPALLPNDLFYISLSKNKPSPGLYLEPPEELTNNPNFNFNFIKLHGSTTTKFQINYISNDMGDWRMWCIGGCNGVLDSTFNGISGPPSDINSINKFIGADEDGNIECWKKDKLVPLNFFINSHKYTIDIKNYILEGDSKYSSKCKSPFTVGYSFNNEWRLGIPFMQQFLTVFDITDHRLAFMPLK